MGCAQNRGKVDEDVIEEFESRLQFSRFTVKELKLAFSHVSGASSVSRVQIQKFIKNLKIEYSYDDQKEVFDSFIKHFEVGEDTYDLVDLLAAVFLLSNNSVEEKALAFFDLFDRRASGSLYKEDAEFAFASICEVVCRYSEGFLDEDEEAKRMHVDIWTRMKEAKVPKLIDYFFEGRAFIKYETFKTSLMKASGNTELLDITSPQSIRRALMEFVFTPHKSKIELQEMYKVRKSKAKYAFQETESSLTPRSDRNTPRNTLDSTAISKEKST
eukprot:CAMPEP_0176441868 /NCGR_PEP_ID=MMETSP0127-20121128/21467_1 /TAXON_ID=938130 /ORGANISM="Platyophrya macrostoma, Strain WH" /LENGTH=271 /DNA_ID=CAMNT_0017826755 /DNA_START=35 /DNA_END=850 /DNA_ORIENTATION=-